jgi:hypothetical protein
MGIIDRRDKYMRFMRILFILCPMDGLEIAEISYNGQIRYCICVRCLFLQRQDLELYFIRRGVNTNGQVTLVSFIPGSRWYEIISIANFLHIRIYTGYSSDQVILTHSHLHGIERSLEVRGIFGRSLHCHLESII